MASLPTGYERLARKRPGLRLRPLIAPRIDMTPMVDLGFLLIAFFVMTATLSEPGVVPLNMPKDSDSSPLELGESYALTLLLDGEHQYAYAGSFSSAVQEGGIDRVTIKELRDLIIRKQLVLDDTGLYKEGRSGLMLLIKASERANYESLIRALDETGITNLKRFALIGLSGEEQEWLQRQR